MTAAVNGNIWLENYTLIHPAGDVTRVSVMPRKITVTIGDAENRCRGCEIKINEKGQK